MSRPIASLGPNPVNFAALTMGSTSPVQNVTLTNSGNAPLELSSVTASTGFGLTNGCGNSVAPRASCMLGITFAPTGAGNSQGFLTVEDNAPGGVQKVPLSGSGLPDFSVALASGASNSTTVSAGATATYTLSVAPIAGFKQTVSFSCTGAPTAATCSVSPASPTLDGTNPTSITVQVTTTVRASAMVMPSDFRLEDAHRFPLTVAFFVTVLLVLMAIRQLATERSFARVFAAILILGILVTASSCGGGGSSGGTQTPPPPPAGTPAGTYTLTVTATSTSGGMSLTHNVKLTLTVN